MTTPPTGRPETPPGVEQALAEIEALLDRLGVPWTLAGAFAATRYRTTTRFTTDADLLIRWHAELEPALAALGFEARVQRVEGEPHLVRTRRREIGVDLIIAGTPYQHEAIQRGLHRTLTIEDVLIHKLVAWRPKDRDDIWSILSSGRPFDRAFVEGWITEIGFEDLWEEARRGLSQASLRFCCESSMPRSRAIS